MGDQRSRLAKPNPNNTNCNIAIMVQSNDLPFNRFELTRELK